MPETLYLPRSIWIRKPMQAGPAWGADLVPLQGIHVDDCIQPDGSSLWAIRSAEQCLGKDGYWTHEPMPSRRDDAYYQSYRWTELADAIAFAEKHAAALYADFQELITFAEKHHL